MSTLEISVDGTSQIIQLGSLSAAVNQQITQAVASASASAATATTEAGIATEQAFNAAESAQQAAAYVAELPALVVQQVATFAALPPSPVGLYLVLADETVDGNPQMYFFRAGVTQPQWFASVQKS